MMGRCVIVGGANINNYDFIREKLSADDYIIFCDSGLKHMENLRVQPSLIVGDFDSLLSEKQELLERYPKEIIHRLPCEKDDTDTLAAIRLAVETGYERFIIYGGLGGRLSHTMANIQSLMFLKEHGLHGELVGNGSRIFVIKDESVVLSARKNGYISVFAYGEKANGVTIKNLKYEVEDAELTNAFPIGVSNEFVGKEATVSVKKGALLVVEETQ